MADPYNLKKVGKFWHCDFVVKGTRIHKSTKCTMKADATEITQKWYDDIVKQAEGVFIDNEHTVEDIWKEWWLKTKPPILSEGHRDGVERNWRLHILPKLKDRPAKSITHADSETLRRAYLDTPSLRNQHHIEAKIKRLEAEAKKKGLDHPEPLPPPAKRSVASSNKVMLHMHLVFAWAVEAGLLQQIPFGVTIRSTQEKPKPTLTKELVPDFLQQVDKFGSIHVRIAVRAMLYWALREKEARVIRWEWFSPDLMTFQHGDRKANDAPRFPVPLDLRTHLQALGVKKEGLMLPNADGLPHSQQFTRKAINAAGAALGIKITPHSMRHSWATMTARATGNAHLIKDGLGHSQIGTAMKYVKLDTRDLAASNAKIFGDLAEIHPKVTRKKIKLRVSI